MRDDVYDCQFCRFTHEVNKRVIYHNRLVVITDDGRILVWRRSKWIKVADVINAKILKRDGLITESGEMFNFKSAPYLRGHLLTRGRDHTMGEAYIDCDGHLTISKSDVKFLFFISNSPIIAVDRMGESYELVIATGEIIPNLLPTLFIPIQYQLQSKTKNSRSVIA